MGEQQLEFSVRVYVRSDRRSGFRPMRDAVRAGGIGFVAIALSEAGLVADFPTRAREERSGAIF